MQRNRLTFAMPEDPDPAAGGGGAPPKADPPADPPKAKSLEELLAALPEDERAVITGEVSKARTEAKNLRDRLKAAEPLAAEHQKLVDAQKTAEQQAADREKAANDRAAQAVARAVQAEVRALAADTFANPAVAGKFLDLASYVNDKGDIDTDAIKGDLASLLVDEPYLGKTPGKTGMAPDKSQGKGSEGGAQDRELAEVRAEIAKAVADGNSARAIALKSREARLQLLQNTP